MASVFSPDQFYLNDPFPLSAKRRKQDSEGAVFFSASRYLEEVHAAGENVQCVALSTYRLHWTCFREEFRMLFNETLAIPSIVLHGERGDERRRPWDEKTRESDSDEESDDEENEHSLPLSSTLTHTQAQPPTHMRVLEVRPQRVRGGVHHAKYMLVCTDAGLHVVVSTANLTPPSCAETSWVQFFPRCELLLQSNAAEDFADVLEDFLLQQSAGLVSGSDSSLSQRFLLDWICGHAGIDELRSAYDFNDVRVRLSSTVPSRSPLPALSQEERDWLYRSREWDTDLVSALPCAQCVEEESKLSLSSAKISYGSIRMREIVSGLDGSVPLSQDDVLILQPTSIGIGINNSYMGSLLEHYLPESAWEENMETLRQERWRMIWPSRETIAEIHRNANTSTHSESEGEEDENEKNDQHSGDTMNTSHLRPGLLFLHARTFSQMEVDIQSQFHGYRPSRAPAVRRVSLSRPPHIKSYARVLSHTNASPHIDDSHTHSHAVGCECYPLAWACISSACLSRGAQGICVPYSVCAVCRHVRQGYWEYRNFELGVVLLSSAAQRLRGLSEDCPLHGINAPSSSADERRRHTSAHTNGQTHTDPQLHKSKECMDTFKESNIKTTVTTESGIAKVILPFPYDLLRHSSPFCDEVGRMIMDPFFHPSSPDTVTKYAGVCTDELRERAALKRAHTTGETSSRFAANINASNENSGVRSLLGRRSFSLMTQTQTQTHAHIQQTNKPSVTETHAHEAISIISEKERRSQQRRRHHVNDVPIVSASLSLVSGAAFATIASMRSEYQCIDTDTDTDTPSMTEANEGKTLAPKDNIVDFLC